ncbi:unnamed protein product, partial [Musa banksii]
MHTYFFSLSSLSTGSNSNLISFHTSQAAASSGAPFASFTDNFITFTSKIRPSLRACVHASKATLL